MSTRVQTPPLLPAMAYIRTENPDRSMRFFAELFGWEAVDVGGTHYVYNVERAPLMRTGHRGRPMPVVEMAAAGDYEVQFAVDDLGASLRTLEANGGTVIDAAPDADFASVDDGQGLRFVLWQTPGPDAYPTPPPRRTSTGIPAYFRFEVDDPDQATGFYATLLGWDPVLAADGAYSVIDNGRVVVTIARAVGAPRLRAYLGVDDLPRAMASVEGLGGTVGEVYDVAGRAAADCADDSGAPFRLVEAPAL